MPVMTADEPLEVLLVDDELSTRELLEQFCRSRNLPVTTASDGRAAIMALERAPARFTIVMTDINMPGADGFEVLKKARAGNRSCHVVMLTGYATLDSALRRRPGGRAGPPPPGTAAAPAAYSGASAAPAAPTFHAPASSRSAMSSGPAAATMAPPAAGTELASRVGTMEDRLGKIEEMLRKAISGTR